MAVGNGYRVPSQVITIQQSFNFPAIPKNIPTVTPWFTNKEFEDEDVHFRLAMPVSCEKGAHTRHFKIQIVNKEMRDWVLKMETLWKTYITATRAKYRVYTASSLCLEEMSGDPQRKEENVKISRESFKKPNIYVIKLSMEFNGYTDEITTCDIGVDRMLKAPFEWNLKCFPASGFQQPFTFTFRAECFVPNIFGSIPSEPSTPVTSAPSVRPEGLVVLDKLHDGLLSDVSLRVSGQPGELRAHRCVLAAGSPVFAAMFRHDLRERQLGVVDVKQPDGETLFGADVVGAALSHLYGRDQLGTLDGRALVDLLVFAHQYQMPGLGARCEDLLVLDKSLDVLELVRVASDLGADRLLEAAVGRIRASPSRQSLCSSASFKELMQSRPDVIQEIIKRL